MYQNDSLTTRRLGPGGLLAEHGKLIERALTLLDRSQAGDECREIILGLLLANAQLREAVALALEMTRGHLASGEH